MNEIRHTEIVKLLNNLINKIENIGNDVLVLQNKIQDVVTKIEDDVNKDERYVFGELGQLEGVGKYYIRVEKGTDIANYIINYFTKISGSSTQNDWIPYLDYVKNSEVFLFNEETLSWDKYTINIIDFYTTNIVIRPIEPSPRLYEAGTKVKLKMWKYKIY